MKGLSGILEHPLASYGKVAVTSEGHEIGRHLWARLIPMWSMSKEGFKQLYEQLPGSRPDFEEVWRMAGGDPKILGELYEVN